MPAKVALWNHFGRLFDFAGREDRASFWPYAAVAFLITTVAAMVIFMPMWTRAMHAMQQFALEHPGQAKIIRGPGQYSISVWGNRPVFLPARSVTIYLTITFGLAVLLNAAAVVRRLHDRGKSGFWGLLPVPFIIYSSVQIPRLLEAHNTHAQPDIALIFSVFLSHVLGNIALIWLIVLLAGKSHPASNIHETA